MIKIIHKNTRARQHKLSGSGRGRRGGEVYLTSLSTKTCLFSSPVVRVKLTSTDSGATVGAEVAGVNVLTRTSAEVMTSYPPHHPHARSPARRGWGWRWRPQVVNTTWHHLPLSPGSRHFKGKTGPRVREVTSSHLPVSVTWTWLCKAKTLACDLKPFSRPAERARRKETSFTLLWYRSLLLSLSLWSSRYDKTAARNIHA